jgi:hypothetical protein
MCFSSFQLNQILSKTLPLVKEIEGIFILQPCLMLLHSSNKVSQAIIKAGYDRLDGLFKFMRRA